MLARSPFACLRIEMADGVAPTFLGLIHRLIRSAQNTLRRILPGKQSQADARRTAVFDAMSATAPLFGAKDERRLQAEPDFFCNDSRLLERRLPFMRQGGQDHYKFIAAELAARPEYYEAADA